MKLENVEDIYKLSPLQEGMLFHSLVAPESDVYFVQLSCTLYSDLNISNFELAWQRLLERHSVLRTSFHWEGLDKPLQMVHRRVKLPIERYDWRGLSAARQQAQLEEFLSTDQSRGLSLSVAPLMRLTLIRLGEECYQCVCSSHHLLMDGWSRGLLLKEVFAIYQERCNAGGVELDEPPPYRDYIAWLQRQDLAAAADYWQKTLKGVTAPTPLGVGRPMAGLPGQEQGYEQQRLWLTSELTARLRQLGQQQGLTLNTFVQGAWALLLSQYCGEADVVFGVTVAGRPAAMARVDEMVGLFINTLPVRVWVSSEMTLLAWLRKLQTQQMELGEFEYSPLVQVQMWSEAPRGQPLFESILVFETEPLDTFIQTAGGSLEVRNVQVFNKTNYPLTLTINPGPRLLLRVIYDCSRFQKPEILRMLGHIERLLEIMVADPERRLSKLRVLTEQERDQLLLEWNDTRTADSNEMCIHQLFEAQVSQTPDTVAVVLKEEHLSYQELNVRANQLARHLQAAGVGPDALVGVCLERSLGMVVGVLGILKAGGAYVPLDPTYPKERLAVILEDAQICMLLTDELLLEELPEHKLPVMRLDSGWKAIAAESIENPVSNVMADNLLYVIYTSGSTGRPKGIGLPHRSLTNLIRWHLATMLKGARTLQFASLSFDASFHEIFAAWCSGGTLLLISEELRRDTVSLARFIQEEGVEKVILPVVALQQLAEEWGYRDQGAPTLKEITTTGEQMQITPQITRLFKLWKECAAHNHYGPSESHVVTAYTLDENPDHWVARPSIGRPIANTEIYLLDREMEPVPVGVVGELYIGGVSLARGYLDRSDLTAEKFIPNPYRGEPGERLYNTGDLARYGSDGNIEFLGRRDYQVKIRGYRIELGEIEAALSRHPSVRDAVVLARADATKHQRLVAYVTPNQQEPLLVNDLRSFLQEKLPEYMVPSAFVLLQKLPLTPSGKVNRKALPAPEQTRPELEGDFSAPHTHTEEILAGIWGAILGVDRVGLQDNFFELGGHSLLGTQVISRVREAFQVELPLRSLFEAPTVAEFVARIEDAGRARRGLSVPPIERVSRERDIPLSFAQHRLWFLDQLEPGASIYNNSAAVRMTGRLNVSALAQSLGEITRRHEVLRTTFHAVDGQPVQVIGPPEPLTLLVGDLRQAGQQYREVEVLRLATEEAQRPFDLARGPLLRIVVLRLDEEEHVALLTTHHIISDAWSIGLLIREMAALYEAFSRGSRSPLPELNIQFADFSAWQRRWLQGDALQERLAYWKQQLGAASASVLPADRPRPATPSHLGARQPFLLPSALYEGLKRLSHRHGVTLFMTLLAAFQTLLSRCAGQNEVVIGADIANRNRGETEGLIGFFINMLALRADLSGDPGFLELLSRVREVTLGAFAHQDLPVEILVKELQPERSLSQSPLFQIVFNFINTPMPSLELSGLTLTTLESNHQAVRFDVSLMMSEGPDGLSGAWVYSTDLFDAETIARISDRFVTLLHSVVAQPEARISRLEIFSEMEKAGQTKEKKALKESNFRKLMDIKPKDFGRSSESMIKMDFYRPERGLPLVIEPDVEDLDLILWARNHREFIESELLKHGAILFRNFNVSSIARFDRFTRSISPELLDYNERSTPRTEVSGKIYTSTEYPANQAIPLHNELSYSRIWPMKIWFFCLQPAQQGGETPIADSRKVFELLDPGIKQRFMRKKVMYIRNYGDGLGLSWQTVFQTTDRKTVEDYCASANIEFEWKDGDRLRTRQIGPAVVTHVKTGERVWFNQVNVHCIFNLDQSLRESLLAVVQEKDYPLDINACYGDGSQIEASILDEIREAYRQTTAVFPWQKGDILMLDNVLVAHGRAPYVGPRKILVAMAEPCKNEDR